MKKAKWIWLNNCNNKDEYIQFFKSFEINSTTDKIYLNISCDTDYTAYINGELTAFGQYSDYPFHKVYDSIDITNYVNIGVNKIALCCYYYGEDSLTYYKGDAGLIFEIIQGENIIAFSNEEVKCRLAKDYISYRKEKITWQQGFNVFYDMSKYDGWNKNEYDNLELNNSVIIKRQDITLNIRPIKKLKLENRVNCSLIKAGSFEYNGGISSAEKQQQAIIFYDAILYNNHITVNKGGIYAIYDLGREEVGFLNIKIKTYGIVKILIGWGEHITDGRIRTSIDSRNFGTEYISCEGVQEYLCTFRRYGARYIQIFAETKDIEIDYITLCPVNYPLIMKKIKFNNSLRQQIYDVSARSLYLCMHDHYEDCPWREQALYTMDSRNEMLCSYYLFNEKEYTKACLDLIGLDKSEDGLLSICSPSNIKIKIPSFSLYYIKQMKEYIQYTNDLSIVQKHYGKLKLILKAFTDKMENGLVPIFWENTNYWNFYEWSEGLCGSIEGTDIKRFDLVLNSLLSFILQDMVYISKILNKNGDIIEYEQIIIKLNNNISQFFDYEKGLYKMYNISTCNEYNELGNSFAILCGAADKNKQSVIAQKFINNDTILTKTTLSMTCFKYDALLKIDSEKYKNYILNDIDQKYGYMLKRGATSFWETLKGENDFNGAGSLCHGWSAMPIYYYNILKG